MPHASALVDETVRVLGGDAGWFMRFVRPFRSEGLYVVDLATVGPAPWREAMAALEHRDMSPWGLDVGDASSLNAFDLRTVSDVPHQIAQTFWGPFGIHSSLTINVVSQNRLVGNVGVLRSGSKAVFRSVDLRRANRRRDRLRAAVEALDVRGDDVQPEVGAAILGPSCDVRFASAEVHAATDLVSLVSGAAQEVGSNGGRTMVGRHLVSFEPMHDVLGSGERMLLARIEATRSMQAVRAMMMSKVKRRVAELAARGATVPEIASHLSRAPDTVRAHLKDVYRELGVGNRVELADAVRGIWS